MDFDLARDLGLNFNRTATPEWTQDLVAEQSIKGGIVITVDQKGQKRYVKILEIIALNFPIMSSSEQDMCILSFDVDIYFIKGDMSKKDWAIKQTSKIANCYCQPVQKK